MSSPRPTDDPELHHEALLDYDVQSLDEKEAEPIREARMTCRIKAGGFDVSTLATCS